MSNKLTREKLQEYIHLEKKIYNLERKNVLKKYDTKIIFADELKKSFDQLEAIHKELKKHVEKEKSDVQNLNQPSIKVFLMQLGKWEDRISKQQLKYEKALSLQQAAEKELIEKQRQYDRAAKIAEIFKRQCDTLWELYQSQDSMMIDIFGGENIPYTETQLRAELAQANEWKQRILLAKFKWTNGRLLLVHAATQLSFGITKWNELKHIERNNVQSRYFAAAEARNNFISASQNVQSCRVYLGHIKFLYATDEDMLLLETTIQNALHDIQSDVVLRKSLEIFSATQKKVISLLQWLDKVINDTIVKDLDKANTDVAKRHRQLKEERFERLKLKVRTDLCEDLVVTQDPIIDDNVTDDELLFNEFSENNIKDISTNEKPNTSDNYKTTKAQPANLPSRIVLFGDVRRKMLDYADACTSIERKNNEVKEKIFAALQAKLHERLQDARQRTPKRTSEKFDHSEI